MPDSPNRTTAPAIPRESTGATRPPAFPGYRAATPRRPPASTVRPPGNHRRHPPLIGGNPASSLPIYRVSMCSYRGRISPVTMRQPPANRRFGAGIIRQQEPVKLPGRPSRARRYGMKSAMFSLPAAGNRCRRAAFSAIPIKGAMEAAAIGRVPGDLIAAVRSMAMVPQPLKAPLFAAGIIKHYG